MHDVPVGNSSVQNVELESTNVNAGGDADEGVAESKDGSTATPAAPATSAPGAASASAPGVASSSAPPADEPENPAVSSSVNVFEPTEGSMKHLKTLELSRPYVSSQCPP